MKNTLMISTQDGACVCSCYDSVNNGTNSLYIELEARNTNPQLNIFVNDTLRQSVSLTTGTKNVVNIPSDYFMTDSIIKVQYVDSEYTGQYFIFNFPDALAGNMTIKQSDDYTFNVAFTTINSGGESGGGEPTTVSVVVNSTKTIETGEPAKVVNVGDDINVALDFYIPTGKTGATGEKGVGVTGTDVMYYKSTSSTELVGGEWLSDAPDWENATYIWTKTVTTYSDGSKLESNPVCITGAQGETGEKGATGATGATGKGVTVIVEQYYLSTSKTTQSGGSWVLTPPTWVSGKYIWTRSAITWTDNTTTYTTPQLANALNSANELATTAKQTADGKNTVFYQASQPSTTGRVKGDLWFDTDDGNKMYSFNGTSWVASPYGSNAIASEAITTAHLVSNAVTADKIDVDDLFAQEITVEGSLKSADYNAETPKGMIVDMTNKKIDSYGDENENVYRSGLNYTWTAYQGSINFNTSGSGKVGKPRSQLKNGHLAVNDTVYKAGAVEVNGVEVLNFNPESIYTPKVNTKEVQCNGNVVATEVIATKVRDVSGNSLAGLKTKIDNLTSQIDTVASKLDVSTTSRLTTANANISELKTITKKMGDIYIVTVEFKPTANISAFSGIFKVSDDIATSSLVLPIPAVCWDDGSTAWFYQQYNNIMNRTALVSGKWYEFTYVSLV